MFSGALLAGTAEQTRLASALPAGQQAAGTADPAKGAKEASALEVSADLGVVAAQLKLARKHAAGDGVKLSHAKAFDLYRSIVDDNADVRPYQAKAQSVAVAFVALANYYRTGIPGTDVHADKRRAARLLWHAASYLGDAEAQCNLAQMYLDGEGVPKNGRLAVNWLANAAKKRHAKSQAILGDLLWRGTKDVPRQPLKGLAFLSLAMQNAKSGSEKAWIDTLYSGAFAHAKDDERQHAAELTARWQTRMGTVKVLVSAPQAEGIKQSSAAAVGNTNAAPEPGAATGVTNVGLEGPAALR